MKKNLTLLIACFVLFGTIEAQVKIACKIISPDKHTVFETGVNENGKLVYHLLFNNEEVIGWSSIGLMIDGIAAGEKVLLKNIVRKTVKEKFAWRLGENDSVSNHYNNAILTCASKNLLFDVEARVFDGTVAFRYQVKDNSHAHTISKDLTRFQFSPGFTLYQYNQESVFIPVAIDTFNTSCDFPATITNSKSYISIGEADNNSFTKAELKRGEEANSLMPVFMRDSAVTYSGSFTTPWRTISVANSAIGLHAFSDLYLRLVDPITKQIPAWIKPGKLIRSQLNTESGIDCIDFAASHHFQYIMFDAGWYGAEFRGSSDPTQVIPAIDMPKVIAYGKQKNIGVILYVNYVGLKAKLDTILPLFKQWGVKGIKFGFVDGLTQQGIQWLAQAIKKTNDYGFIVDVHDNYKPTGLSRKFPALLTQEGIRGDENSPDAFHNTVLPFTRFLAGPADFTFCYPNKTNDYAKNIKVSMAQQLALTVVYFSPLQSIFWYGKPKEYTNEGEIEFFAEVPTVWNETHYLAGEIGKYISVARRSGKEWFIGNVAGLEDWKTSIPLNFLEAGQSYTATIFEDDGAGSIRKRRISVKRGDFLSVDIKAKAGQAIIFNPQN